MYNKSFDHLDTLDIEYKMVRNCPKYPMAQNGLWISSPKISERYFFVGHVLFGTDQANGNCYTLKVQNSLSFKVFFSSYVGGLLLDKDT